MTTATIHAMTTAAKATMKEFIMYVFRRRVTGSLYCNDHPKSPWKTFFSHMK